MCFLRLLKENEVANTQTDHLLETAIITHYVKYPSLPPGIYASHQLCHSSVIMVYPTQYRNSDYLVHLIWGRNRKRRRLRNPLPKPLMRSGLIEIDNVRIEKPEELLFMENQEMIQTFAPHTAQKAFADSICPARVRYGVRRTLMPLVIATRAKCCPNFLSLSRIKYFGACPYGVASRSCCATQESVGARVTFTWMTFRDFCSTMKKAKRGRKKRSITCKKSQAQISAAWLRRNVFQFCPPTRLGRVCFMYF